MTHRGIRLFVEIFAGLIAGLLLLTGVGVWRLSQGPVSLSFLTPAIQNALQQIDSPFDIEISDTVLTWGGWDRAIDILVTDVTLRQDGENPLATLPAISLGLSIEALSKGVIAPTNLELIQPEVVVRRFADGSFSFGLVGEQDGLADGNQDVQHASEPSADDAPVMVTPAVLDTLMRPPEAGSALSFLKQVSIIDASVTMDDQVAGLTWRMPDANIVLVRDRFEIRGNMVASLQADEAETRISAVMLRQFNAPSVTFTLSFDSFEPALVARALPEAAFLRGFDTPVSGSMALQIARDGSPVDASLSLAGGFGAASFDLGFSPDQTALVADVTLADIDTKKLADLSPDLGFLKALDTRLNGIATLATTLDGDIQFAQFEVVGGAGRVTVDAFDVGELDFRSITLRGRANDKLETLTLDQFEIGLLDQSLAAFSGEAVLQDGVYAVTLAGEARDIEFDALKEYWPETLATDARNWLVPNLLNAFVPKATLSLEAKVPADDFSQAAIDDIGGRIWVQNGEVHYFRPLPPVTDASAEVDYGPDWFDIRVSQGTLVDTIQATSAVMTINNLGTTDETAISVNFNAPMTDILTVLDLEPLSLITKLGIKPEDVTGRGNARLDLAFNLKKSLKVEDLVYSAEGRLENFGLKNAPLGADLTNGSLDLSLDRSGMTIAGSTLFNETPITLAWRENFSPDEVLRSQYDVSGIVTDEALTALGFPASPYLTGAAGVSLVYRGFRNGGADLAVSANLDAARLDAAPLPWSKQAGEPAKLDFILSLPNQGPPSLDQFALTSTSMDVAGAALFQPEFQDVQNIRLDRLVFDQADLSGLIEKRGPDDWKIILEGPRINVSQLLEDEEADGEEEAQAALGPKYDITARFDEVFAAEGQRLTDVTLSAVQVDGSFQSLSLDAAVSDEGSLEIEITPKGTGNHLFITTNDGGATLATLDWTNRIQGGALRLDATRQTKDAPYVGTVRLENFRLTRAPALARVLEFISVTGALSALSGSGMDFTLLEGDVEFKDGAAKIGYARAYNASVGITASGSIDTNTNQLNVKGAVAPVYVLNRVIANIPILGDLITGGDGEGLFAWDYQIQGKIDNADVSVNPLSVLAPGILRRLFRGDGTPREVPDNGDNG